MQLSGLCSAHFTAYNAPPQVVLPVSPASPITAVFRASSELAQTIAHKPWRMPGRHKVASHDKCLQKSFDTRQYSHNSVLLKRACSSSKIKRLPTQRSPLSGTKCATQYPWPENAYRLAASCTCFRLSEPYTQWTLRYRPPLKDGDGSLLTHNCAGSCRGRCAACSSCCRSCRPGSQAPAV